MPFFWVSLFILLGSLAAFVEVLIGARKIKHLDSVLPHAGTPAPKVSVIFSALNEARTIEPALRSMLAIDYPGLEVIAINDRSSDGTGAILDSLAAGNGRIRTLHIADLPSGWLGKNHALHQGAQMANGDYLLFTDADVVFDASSIARAIAHCEQKGLDHLTVFPEVPVKEPLLAMILLNTYFAMFLWWKPWRIGTSRNYFAGIGAFNLIRRDAYRSIGGHEAIRMEVLDDMMLGKRVKQGGLTQEALFGAGMVSVVWYGSTLEMFKGMQKNSFAIVDYKPGKLIAATALALFPLWPWMGLIITAGAAWWLNLATVVATTIFYLTLLRPLTWSRLCLIYMPVTGIVTIAMLWTGCISTMMRGGINWRGTFYPLDLLRQEHEKLLSLPQADSTAEPRA
jgi:cellulose synthase/poly-beta-1,6-N-acetylglucosamine synthase-like glycosyltransferase